MTYLELARRAAIECGVASSTAIQTALPTVAGTTGSLGRICNWVNDALSDILMDCDQFDFLRSSHLAGGGISFATVAGQSRYPLGTGAGTVGVTDTAFGRWDEATFRCQPTAVGFRGEAMLDVIPFDAWRDGYMYGAMQSVQTRPAVVAIGPDLSLCLGPPPNGDYTITGDYWLAPVSMVTDTDTPTGLPERFHMLICYRVLMKYGQYEAAQEVYARGKEEGDGMYAQLMALRAPRMGWGGALA
jgi:hypothetical protein